MYRYCLAAGNRIGEGKERFFGRGEIGNSRSEERLKGGGGGGGGRTPACTSLRRYSLEEFTATKDNRNWCPGQDHSCSLQNRG